jgi:large subunit ribosomal protein L24
LRRERVWVAEIDVTKKDGTKIPFPLHPSNLVIIALELNDKKRKKKIESRMKSGTK